MEDAANEVKEAKKRDELLLVACSQGLLADAESLIAMGARPDAKDKKGVSALHFAAAGGHLSICKLLFSKGAEPEVEDQAGRTPLHVAACGEHAEVISFLLSKGAWVDAYDGGDSSPLHYAAQFASPDAVRALLQGGAKLDLKNRRDLSPAGEALLRGRMEVVQLLAQHQQSSGEVKERPRGYTLLHLAVATGRLDAVKYLIGRGADVNAMLAGVPRSPVAAEIRHWHGCAALSDNGLTALHSAALTGRLEAAEALLTAGADPCIRSQDGALAEEMVPAADGGSPSGGEAVRLETLLKLLQKARKSTATTSTLKGDGSEVSVGDGRPAVTSFAALSVEEQTRKVQSWASWTDERLAGTVGLNAEAVRRLGEVRKMRSLLETHSALLALHSDDSFQADAKLPRVLAAIEAVRLDPSKLKDYREDKQAATVIMKLKQFQDVMRSHGHMQTINLQDLVNKDNSQLDETKRRHAGLQSRMDRAMAAAIAAASYVREDASKAAAGEVEGRKDGGGGAEVQARKADDASKAGAESAVAEVAKEGVDEGEDDMEHPSFWRQTARTLLIALVSYLLANYITQRVMFASPEDATHPHLPTQQGGIDQELPENVNFEL